MTVYDADGVPVTFKQDRLARVNRPHVEQGVFEAAGHRFRRFESTVFGIQGIPDPKPDVYWIVSSETAREGRHIRSDLVAPHRFIKKVNEKTGVNEIVACEALIQFNGPANRTTDRQKAARQPPRAVDGADVPSGHDPTQAAQPPVVDEWFDDDPGPTQEELDAREAALDTQYDQWAEEETQAAWVEEQLNSRPTGAPPREDP